MTLSDTPFDIDIYHNQAIFYAPWKYGYYTYLGYTQQYNEIINKAGKRTLNDTEEKGNGRK